MGDSLSKKEMIAIVVNRLRKSGLRLQYPEVVAQSLLSEFDYDLDRVLELAV